MSNSLRRRGRQPIRLRRLRRDRGSWTGLTRVRGRFSRRFSRRQRSQRPGSWRSLRDSNPCFSLERVDLAAMFSMGCMLTPPLFPHSYLQTNATPKSAHGTTRASWAALRKKKSIGTRISTEWNGRYRLLFLSLRCSTSHSAP
jgi:hypothetical protein